MSHKGGSLPTTDQGTFRVHTPVTHGIGSFGDLLGFRRLLSFTLRDPFVNEVQSEVRNLSFRWLIIRGSHMFHEFMGVLSIIKGVTRLLFGLRVSPIK